MNLRHIVLSVRHYGFSGIWHFLERQGRERRFRQFLRSTNRDAPPEKGLTIISSLRQPTSLSKVMRDIAILCKKAGVPYQTYNIPHPNDIPASEVNWFTTPPEAFCANRYTHVLGMREQWDVGDPRCKSYSIEFWEFEDGAAEGQPELLKFTNILALSEFNRKAFLKAVPPTTRIAKMLYPFQFVHGPLAPREVTLRKYGLPEDAFVVFFNFDYASSYNRKNPEAILRAFAQSIARESNTRIVFKTMRAKRCAAQSARLHAAAAELGLTDRLVTIDDFIPQEDLVNLTNACDVYMSLHRGEGFGLGIAEAMALGKPVIVSDYSSTTEFCNDENSLPVPCAIVAPKPDQRDVDGYSHVTRWAEPDVDAAAKALRRLYDDPSLRQRLGESGRRFIVRHFSAEEFKRSIEEFLAGN